MNEEPRSGKKNNRKQFQRRVSSSMYRKIVELSNLKHKEKLT